MKNCLLVMLLIPWCSYMLMANSKFYPSMIQDGYQNALTFNDTENVALMHNISLIIYKTQSFVQNEQYVYITI